MKVCNADTEGLLLTDSVKETEGNGGINYGGPGDGEGRAREHASWEEFDEYSSPSVWDE